MDVQTNSSSYMRDVIKRLLSHKLAVFGLIVLVVEVLAVLILPHVMKLDPYAVNYGFFGAPPSKQFILGCDDVGRDLFARLVYGGRVSLSVGLFSALISFSVGVPLGLLAGYLGKSFEMVVMRLADIFMSFPSMILVLVLASVLGQSMATIIIVIGVIGWPGFARLIHGTVLSVRERDYVESAVAIGTKDWVILLRYILPNSFSPVIIAFTFRTAEAIITESAISFLGLGIQPPGASWGNILYYAQSIGVLAYRPWAWLPAGIMLVLTVLSINFFGDGIRDALDVKMSQS